MKSAVPLSSPPTARLRGERTIQSADQPIKQSDFLGTLDKVLKTVTGDTMLKQTHSLSFTSSQTRVGIRLVNI